MAKEKKEKQRRKSRKERSNLRKEGRTGRLRSKIRISIFNDTSHKEIFLFRSHGITLLIVGAISLITIIGLVTVLIAYTPIRQFIPGYPDAETREMFVDNALKIDSLERSIKLWDFHLHNIQRIVSGAAPLNLENIIEGTLHPDSLAKISDQPSKEELLLREEVMKEEQQGYQTARRIDQIEGLHFFSPVKGVITHGFNPAIDHPYVDIAAPENSPVVAVLDGTVIFAAWTDETGYSIHIQHENNLISIYKHNSKLLKKSGEKVKAGTAVALLGSSGELSSGNHLHFELWHQGVPIDPVKYISF